MSDIPVIISAAELPDLFATRLWEGCTSCLSAPPDPGKPFCLSFEMVIDGEDWFASNQLNAHLYLSRHPLNTMASKDEVAVLPLGHEHPGITQACAVGAVSVLGHERLFDRIYSFIVANKSAGQEQSFRAHILPDGIFIVPTGAFKCASDIKQGIAPLALLPGDFASTHNAIASLARFRTGVSLLLKSHMRRQFAPETYLPDIRHTAKLPEPTP